MSLPRGKEGPGPADPGLASSMPYPLRAPLPLTCLVRRTPANRTSARWAAHSVVQAVVARDAPEAEQGRANSTFMMGLDVGPGFGPMILDAVDSPVSWTVAVRFIGSAHFLF